jgi:hypothetical protein
MGRRTGERTAEKAEPANFEFVKKNGTPTFRFAGSALMGAIDRHINAQSIQSHYFIKFTNGKSVEDNMASLSSITFDFNNTVGPKSISKQELILKFNPVLA